MAKKQTDDTQKVEIALPPGMSPETFKSLLEKAAQASNGQVPFTLFHEWMLGDRQKGRVYIDSYKGKAYFNLRKWYQKLEEEDNAWHPGKGYVFSPEEIDDIIRGLQAAKKWAEEHDVGQITIQSDI